MFSFTDAYFQKLLPNYGSAFLVFYSLRPSVAFQAFGSDICHSNEEILVYIGMLPCLIPSWHQIVSRSDLVVEADHSLDVFGTQEAQFQGNLRELEREFEEIVVVFILLQACVSFLAFQTSGALLLLPCSFVVAISVKASCSFKVAALLVAKGCAAALPNVPQLPPKTICQQLEL